MKEYLIANQSIDGPKPPEKMTDIELLESYNRLKTEVQKRKTSLFVDFLKQYDVTHKDQFGMLNWLNILLYFNEQGYSDTEVQHLLDDAKEQRILNYAIIPTRNIEYREIQISWLK